MTAQLTITEAVDVPDRLWIAAMAHHRTHRDLLRQVARHYQRIQQSALAAVRDVPTVSMRDVFGALRLDQHRRSVGADGFVLNNSHCAAYGRLLIEHYPSLDAMVSTRTRRTDLEDCGG